MHHGLFLKHPHLSNRQDAKVAKSNKIATHGCILVSVLSWERWRPARYVGSFACVPKRASRPRSQQERVKSTKRGCAPCTPAIDTPLPDGVQGVQFKKQRATSHADLRIQLQQMRTHLRPPGAQPAGCRDRLSEVRRDQAAQGVLLFCRTGAERRFQGLRQLQHQPRLPVRRQRRLRMRLRLGTGRA